MKKNKILMPLVVAAVIVLMVLGIAYAVRKSQEKTVMVIPASSLNYGGGMFNASTTMDGTITADVSQDIYISSTQTVDEVYVKEGQKVYVGDRLLSYDTEKTSMKLEKEKISREQIELKIDVAKRNLATLKKLKPVSVTVTPEEEEPGEEPEDYEEDYGEDYFEEEDPDESLPEPETTGEPTSTPVPTKAPDYSTVTLYDVLDESAKPYNESEDSAGTAENPYRFLCTEGTEIQAAFLNMMSEMAQSKQESVYFSLEIYEIGNAANTLLASWTMNALFLDKVEDDWTRYIYLYPVVTGTPDKPTEAPDDSRAEPEDDMPHTTAAPSPIPSATPIPGQSEEEDAPKGNPTGTPEITSTDEPDPTETTAPDDVDGADDLTDARVPAVTSPSADMAGGNRPASASGSDVQNLESKAMVVSVSERGYVYLANEEKSDSSAIAGLLGLIESDAQMTKEEIAAQKKQEEANLTSLQLDLRASLLAIKSAEEAVREGTVLSRMNGVVKKVGDKDQISNDGSPFLSVTSEEGLYVKSYLSEKLLGKVYVGDTVEIMAWDSGQNYTGRVRDISIYPDTSGYYGSSPTASLYPMTISFTAGTGAVKNGEWVMVTFDTSGAGEEESFADEMGMMYLYKPFIREENGEMYVMKRGADGLLVKQIVEVGKLSGDGYEILSGLTTDDYVAFPYGKDVKEGAKTREGSLEELYES